MKNLNLRKPRMKRMHGSSNRLNGCPLTRNRTGWCFALCQPEAGLGACGRAAPHAIIGRTQRAILNYKARQERRMTG